MLKFLKFPYLTAIALSLTTVANAQIYTISDATSTFAPSFRNEANSTYFGWTNFRPASGGEVITNPSVNIGNGGLDGTINQEGTADILASAGTIYNGTDGRTVTLSLTVPTSGTPGASGFTTIIIQGLTSFGKPAGNVLVNMPTFSSINGVEPVFVSGLNSNVSVDTYQGQWWVKYELPGNLSEYDIDITISNIGGFTTPLTISRLEVDTYFSETGFALDAAQAVPEPSTYVLLALAGFAFVWKMKRRAGGLN